MSWAIIAIASVALTTGTSLVAANQQRQQVKGQIGQAQRAEEYRRTEEEKNKLQSAMRLQKTRQAPAATQKSLASGTALGSTGAAPTAQGGKTLLGL